MEDEDAGPYSRLNGRVALWLARCAAVILAVMAVITFADVIGRYAFNRPLTFTLEFTELAMGLIVFLAVGLVTHTREHVSVDFVTLRMAPKLRAAVDVFINIVTFGYLSVLVWRLGEKSWDLYELGDMTPTYFILLWPFGLIMTISALLFLTSTLLHIFNGGGGSGSQTTDSKI
ncbi:MAG: TRAP transporter small permease [Rhodospirillales bacterium]|nr:TRAP transporter small permease [Rhodospirillales bacterium]